MLQDHLICIAERDIAGGTGVAYYTRAVTAALPLVNVTPARLAAEPGGAPRLNARWANRLHALNPRPRLLSRRFEGGTEIFSLPDAFRIAQIYFDLYRRLLPLRPPVARGLVHWPYPVPMRVEGWINVYTVHDLIPLLQPDLTPIDTVRHRRLLGNIMRSAEGILTVSRTATDQIRQWAPDRLPPLVDCGEAVFLPAVRGNQEAPPRDYLLVCGSIEPRKNIAAIVAAHRLSDVDMPLVIVGPDGWRASDVRHSVIQNHRVRWLPYQPREALVSLIRGARALLMPSLAEGFGLPVVEAMALGTPVITSAGGALEETASGAALLVDPTDIVALADAIRAIVLDDELASRLAATGLGSVARFSAIRFANRLRDAYSNFIASASAAAYRPG